MSSTSKNLQDYSFRALLRSCTYQKRVGFCAVTEEVASCMKKSPKNETIIHLTCGFLSGVCVCVCVCQVNERSEVCEEARAVDDLKHVLFHCRLGTSWVAALSFCTSAILQFSSAFIIYILLQKYGVSLFNSYSISV